jgi:hypothetical protein
MLGIVLLRKKAIRSCKRGPVADASFFRLAENTLGQKFLNGYTTLVVAGDCYGTLVNNQRIFAGNLRANAA